VTYVYATHTRKKKVGTIAREVTYTCNCASANEISNSVYTNVVMVVVVHCCTVAAMVYKKTHSNSLKC